MRETWYTEVVHLHEQEYRKQSAMFEMAWDYNEEMDRVEFITSHPTGTNKYTAWYVTRSFWEDNKDEMPYLVKERIRVSNA